MILRCRARASQERCEHEETPFDIFEETPRRALQEWRAQAGGSLTIKASGASSSPTPWSLSFPLGNPLRLATLNCLHAGLHDLSQPEYPSILLQHEMAQLPVSLRLPACVGWSLTPTLTHSCGRGRSVCPFVCPGRAGWLDGSDGTVGSVCVCPGPSPLKDRLRPNFLFSESADIGPDFTDRPPRASPLSARSFSRRAAKQKARAPTEASRVFSQHGRSPVGWSACGTRAPHRRR